MASGTGEDQSFIRYTVDKKPIRFEMAITPPLPVSDQGVVFVTSGEFLTILLDFASPTKVTAYLSPVFFAALHLF